MATNTVVPKTQEELKMLHGNQQNFFYENISQKLKKLVENPTKILEGFNSISEDKEITPEQFELLGCFSYLVGIDYTNQPKLSNEIAEKVKLRFADYNFSNEILKSYTEAVLKITETNLLPAKEELKNQILKVIHINIKDERFAFNSMRANIKSIFNTSYIPVNTSISINEILVKTDYTYDDIIKLNFMIQTHCKLMGKKGVKNLMKLHNDENWVKYLQKALILFDYQKFAIVYFDGILSVKESTKKFPWYLYEIISGDLNNIDGFDGDYSKLDNLPKAEVIDEKKPKEKKSKELKSQTTYEKIADDEMAIISAEKPIEFIYHVFCDSLGYHITSKDDIFKAIEKLFVEEDYIQHIYHYMKKQGSLVKVGDKFEKIDIEIKGIFDEKIQQLREEYKTNVEEICKEIPKDNLDKIVSYINICIGDLLFETEDQKQYLISQLVENGITTYQHLMQITELIENSLISGDQLISYVILHQYLKGLSNFEEIFKVSENLGPLHTKLSIYMGFNDFFKLAEPKPIEESVDKK